MVTLPTSLLISDCYMLFNLAILFGTLVAMEGVGTLAHKYIMHGWGWWLHRSHHEPRLGMLETNDVYRWPWRWSQRAWWRWARRATRRCSGLAAVWRGMACCMCWPTMGSFIVTGLARPNL